MKRIISYLSESLIKLRIKLLRLQDIQSYLQLVQLTLELERKQS